MKKTFKRVAVALLCVILLAASVLSVSAAKTYTDVKSGDWYYEFVNYMSDKGIINGYTDNTFRPNNYVKRTEFIKMMVETFGLEMATTINYTDVDSDDWLYDNTALEQINYYLESRPDVLFVGLAQYKAGKTTPIYAPNYQSRIEAIKGWSGSCGKVIEKNLATRQECLYCEGTLKEDRNQHCKVCIYMNSFKNLPKPIYVWNRENHKSVTTIRDKIIWGTSTIRHYADTLQLYLSEKGREIYNLGLQRLLLTVWFF